MKLAILVTHPVQYFVPIFKLLGSKNSFESKVFFGCKQGVQDTFDKDFGISFKWDINLLDGYNHEFINSKSIESLKGFSGLYYAFKAYKKINHYKPDYVLIFSYSPIFIFLTTLLISRHRYSLMLRAETTDIAIIRSKINSYIRNNFLKIYYKNFSHFFPIGTNSENHYLSKGVSANKLSKVLYSIDFEYFQTQLQYWSPKRKLLREELGICSEDHVLIFSGKIAIQKNPMIIVESLKLLEKEIIDKIWILVVGDGNLKIDFQNSIKKILKTRVIFPGFTPQSLIGKYYTIADTLILPSSSGETWGLVVNEAIQFGKKIIISDKVGASNDLIFDNDIGYVFKSNDAYDLSIGIKKVIETKNSKTYEEFLPRPKQLVDAIIKKLI